MSKKTKTGKNLRAIIGSGPTRNVWEFPASFSTAIAVPAAAERRTDCEQLVKTTEEQCEMIEEQGKRIEEQEKRNEEQERRNEEQERRIEEQERRIEEQERRIEEQERSIEGILMRMGQSEIELGKKSGEVHHSPMGTLKIVCDE